MFNRPGVTYESAQARKYLLGRTEVIRSTSNESKAWVEAMLDSKQPRVGPRFLNPWNIILKPTSFYLFMKTDKLLLFTKAARRHVQYATWAADGQGVDHHFFGLKKMLKEGEPLPEIFTDPAFGQSSHWEMSTSQLSSRYLDGWGYGEGEFHIYTFSFVLYHITALNFPFFTVVPDGYGLSYSIGDDYIRWTITSLKRDTAELKNHLGQAAAQVKAMLMAADTSLETKL